MLCLVIRWRMWRKIREWSLPQTYATPCGSGLTASGGARYLRRRFICALFTTNLNLHFLSWSFPDSAIHVSMCLCIVGYLFSGEPKVHGVQSAADRIPTLSYYYRQLTKTKIHLTAVLGESGGFFKIMKTVYSATVRACILFMLCLLYGHKAFAEVRNSPPHPLTTTSPLMM